LQPNVLAVPGLQPESHRRVPRRTRAAGADGNRAPRARARDRRGLRPARSDLAAGDEWSSKDERRGFGVRRELRPLVVVQRLRPVAVAIDRAQEAKWLLACLPPA